MSDEQWQSSGSRPWQSQNHGHRQWDKWNRQGWQTNHQKKHQRHQNSGYQINSQPQYQQYNTHQYDHPNAYSQYGRYRDGPQNNINQDAQPNRFQNVSQNHFSDSMQVTTSASKMSDTIMTSRDEATEKQTKAFQEMTRLENTEYQLSSANYDIDQVPEEIEEGVNDFDEPNKDIAVKYAITKATTKMQATHIDDDEDDDEDEYDDDDDSNKSDFSYYKDEYDDGAPYSKKQKKEYMYSDKQLSEFFNGLKNNLVFDMGFRVNGIYTNVEKNCWCPCGRHMSAWRGQFDLEYLAGKGSEAFCETSAKMVPSGLMSHLRKKGETCPLHHGISEYLMKLYGNMRGTGHKALFCQGDAEYKAAEAAEKREVNKLLNLAYKERNQAERKLREAKMEIDRIEKEKEDWMRNLKESNPDRFKDVRDLDDAFKALNISDEEKEADIDPTTLRDFDLLIDTFFHAVGVGLSKAKKKPILNVKQYLEKSFDINRVFEEMEATEKGLFSDNYENFIINWNVKFAAFNQKDRIDQRKEMIAGDEGGPTREFFSLIWKHLEHLHVSVKSHVNSIENYEIDLFSSTPGGLIPNDDSYLMAKVDLAIKKTKTHENQAEIQDRIERYYRVVGIILYRAIASGNLIAHFVMPSFYRNVFLLNIEPKDKGKYSKKQMLIHLKEIDLDYQHQNEDRSETNTYKLVGKRARDIVHKSVKHLKSLNILDDDWNEYDDNLIIDEEHFFSIYLQKTIIEKQKIAIDAIRTGLSLCDLKLYLPPILKQTSLKYVSERFFAAPHITADELIERLVLCEPAESVKKKQKKFKETQTKFFNTTLKEVIQEMGNDDLESFTSFCTGFNYLPHRHQKGAFKIIIEFNITEMKNEMSLPVAHTCDNTLKLPAQAYGNDKEIFKSKLHKAMKLSKGFSIQ